MLAGHMTCCQVKVEVRTFTLSKTENSVPHSPPGTPTAPPQSTRDPNSPPESTRSSGVRSGEQQVLVPPAVDHQLLHCDSTC